MRWFGFSTLAVALLFFTQGQSLSDTKSAKTLKELLNDLKHGDPTMRIAAIQGIAALGPEANKDAGKPILTAMKDKDLHVRIAACTALGMIGLDTKDQPEGLKDLQALLDNSQNPLRVQAALTLARFGPLAKGAIPKLIKLADDQDSHSWELRKSALIALGAIAPDQQGAPGNVLRACTEALKDKCLQVQLEALFAIGTLGPPGPQGAADKSHVLSKLTPMLKDKDKSLQIWSHVAYMRMDKPDDKHMKEIAKYLTDAEPEIRVQAIRGIGVFRAEGRAHLSDLIKALGDKEPMVAVVAAGALAGMGTTAKSAIPELKKLKEHKEELVRQAAEEAIKQIETEKKP